MIATTATTLWLKQPTCFLSVEDQIQNQVFSSQPLPDPASPKSYAEVTTEKKL